MHSIINIKNIVSPLILVLGLIGHSMSFGANDKTPDSPPGSSSHGVDGPTDKILVKGRTGDLTSALGRWRSIDDETKKPKSIVEITTGADGKLAGKIVQLFREPNEDQQPKCDKCKGDKKDQPILGMQIMEGFKKKDENRWTDGEILDPKNGKIYSCKLTLVDGGKKMEVRGYIGFSLLGRTQVWERVD